MLYNDFNIICVLNFLYNLSVKLGIPQLS